MNRHAFILLVSVVLLFALGLTMIFNTTSAEVLDRFLDRSTYHAMIKQLLYAVVGIIGAIGVWFIGYQNLVKLSSPLLISATVLLILVFLPGIGQQINGAHRWINVFGNSFQPSEFVKFLIPLYFIGIISKRTEPLELRPFIQLLAKLAIPIGLILIEPDNGTVAIIFSAFVILFILSRQKWLYWALPLGVLFACGVIVATASVGLLFRTTEKIGVDCRDAVQAMAGPDQDLTLRFDPAEASKLLSATGDAGRAIDSHRASLAIIYSYGDFTAATNFVRSDDPAVATIKITRASCVPANRIEALFKNPFANLTAAQTAPLKIEKALVGSVPEARHGWLVAMGLYLFIAFYALGPGVVVWLALSELMPTRIRSNGMSIALVLNQMVSTTIAAIFLPFVSKHGYSSMFFLFAGCTVVYLAAAAFFLPETKGKTLEEIEAHFEGTPAAGR